MHRDVSNNVDWEKKFEVTPIITAKKKRIVAVTTTNRRERIKIEVIIHSHPLALPS